MKKFESAVEFIFSSYKRTAAILFVGAAVLAIPITLNLLGQEQDVRQKAANICENVSSDILLVIDKSGSMDKVSGSEKAITKAKQAASNFIDIIASSGGNRIGLVTFASRDNVDLNSPLTDNFNSVKTEVNKINATGKTCTECGIKKANDELSTNKRTEVKNAVILLTDGRANSTINNDSASFTNASNAALEQVKQGFAQNETAYFTIGLGNDIQEDFLQEIANLTGGRYFFAPNADNLQSIYNQISQIIGKSSVSGFVYDDENGNGTHDTNEAQLAGWTVTLTNNTAQNSSEAITDDSGGFSFTGLCGGEYSLNVIEQSGWTITSPANNLYEVVLTNGDSEAGKNFGVQSPTLSPSPTEPPPPTPTCTPRPACLDTEPRCLLPEPDGGFCPAPDITSLKLSVTLAGIGSSQDVSLGLNNSPNRLEREGEVKILNSQNQEIASFEDTFTYNSVTGTYETAANLDSSILSGSYLIKIRFDNTLWKGVPGIQNITAGTENQTPTARLVTGDINQDNEINLSDYNSFITCLQDGNCGQNVSAFNLLQKVFSVLKTIFVSNVTAQTPTPQVCGTIAGLTCPSGYSCYIEQQHPDAQGYCCQERPVCLDNDPPCLLPEPAEGWCPNNNLPTPEPTSKPQNDNLSNVLFDFNDDGGVDELDLNILYVGFASRLGD